MSQGNLPNMHGLSVDLVGYVDLREQNGDPTAQGSAHWSNPNR